MRRERGFTLLETLVALTVLAVVLGSVFNLFSSGLRGLSRGDERLTLALIAESLLERSGLDLLGTANEASGTTPDGVRWRISRTLFVPPPEPPLPDDPADEPADEPSERDEPRSQRGAADASSPGETRSPFGGARPEANERVTSNARLRLWRIDVVVESLRGERFALATWRAGRAERAERSGQAS